VQRPFGDPEGSWQSEGFQPRSNLRVPEKEVELNELTSILKPIAHTVIEAGSD